MSEARARSRTQALRTCRSALQITLLCAAAVSCKNVATIWSTESPSPDGLWVATARTDQYSGPGNAAIASSVWLRRTKGRQDEINVFEAEQDTKSIGLTLNWMSPTHLQITYKEPVNIDFQAIKCGLIDISVQHVQK
jgi:hypothetical protein